MIKIYGSMLCPDCMACRKDLDEAGTAYEYLDFSEDLKNLKEFLKMDILSIYPTLSREEKRVLWRSVIDQIVVSPGGNFTVKFL